jgi:hypothetical protein
MIIYLNLRTHSNKLDYRILMYLLRKYNSFNKTFHKYDNYTFTKNVDQNKQMLKIYPSKQGCSYVKNVIDFCDRDKTVYRIN